MRFSASDHGGGADVHRLPDAVRAGVVERRPLGPVPGDVADDGVVLLDGLLEAAVHLALGPVLEPLVLQPLVVRDGHAAGVADDVGDDVDLARHHHAVALAGGRAVRALGDELHLEPLRDVARDLLAERGGDADVRVDRPRSRPWRWPSRRGTPPRCGAGSPCCRARTATSAATSMPLSSWIVPFTSFTATIFAPSRGEDLGRRRADVAEALHDARARP